MDLLNTEISSGSHQVEINTSSLPAGIYVVKLESGELQATQRLVVTR
jgi:hypothetical protein